MSNINHILNRTAAQISVRFGLFMLMGGAVLPSNNGPVYAAGTRNPFTDSGLQIIQGCH